MITVYICNWEELIILYENQFQAQYYVLLLSFLLTMISQISSTRDPTKIEFVIGKRFVDRKDLNEIVPSFGT